MSIWCPKGLLFSRRSLHTFKHWSGVELTVVSDFLPSIDCSPPGFSVLGIFQARIPEWVAISSSSGSSQTQYQTQVSWVSWTGMRILYCWATEEFPMKRTVVSKFENLGQAIDGSLGQRVGNLFSVIRCCCSVAKSCPTLCYFMNCSTPGFPVLHYLSEFAQTHVHWVGDAIQPSHPLSSPSPPALNLSQNQGLFPMNWLFASDGQSIGALASVLPMNIQGWFSSSHVWMWELDYKESWVQKN